MDLDSIVKPEQAKASRINLPIPKKFVILAIAGAVLLIACGAAIGLSHAKLKHAVAPQLHALASTATASAKKPPTSCSGVVRDIYRQAVDEDSGVTLAEVRSEVLRSGVNCVPVPEIAAKLKELSPACRDMVQYTFYDIHDSHADITVNDVREKVVQKSVACEHDRRPTITTVARQRAK